MAHQDYVSRAKAKKNAKNPYKPKKSVARKGSKKAIKEQQERSAKNKLIGVLTIVLIAGSAFGLWQLKNNPATKTPLVVTDKDQQTPVKSNSDNESELPAPPDETWTYVNELQKEKVEIGEYEVKENGPYKMVCGSFRQRSRAETLKAQMAFAGIESIIQTAKSKSTTWYKVALGPYSKKRMAEKDKHKLKRNKITGCQIWLWR